MKMEAEVLCRSAIEISGYFLDEYRETAGSNTQQLLGNSFTWISYEVHKLYSITSACDDVAITHCIYSGSWSTQENSKFTD